MDGCIKTFTLWGFDKRTEGDAEVAEGATSDGHVDSELGVAESGEECTEASNGVGENDGGSGVVKRGVTRRDEYSGADHAAEAQPDEVEPSERFLHVGTGTSSDLPHFLIGRGN